MKEKKYDIIIIGAGAAGLMAACECSKTTNSVLVLERMDSPGKKILATGNGKCNLTNLYMNDNVFRGSGQKLALYGLNEMSPEKLRRYFYQNGMLTMERNGYVYPMTEQAKSVLKMFLSVLARKKISIKTGEEVTKIKVNGEQNFEVHTKNCHYTASNVIVACGGMASPKLGSNGSGYELVKKLGIKLRKPLPALTGLCSPKKIFKQLSGVRTKGCLSYFDLDGHYWKENGEIQLAAYGISGIPVFQLSRFVISDLEKKKELEVTFDFFPDLTFQEIKTALKDFRNIEGISSFDALNGLVHEKWVPVLLNECKIDPNAAAESVPEKNWNKCLNMLKSYPIPVNGYRDFENAQACQGGVLAGEISNTMESKKYKGLYLVGELVDVDGTCGGYNLHWAFTSGYLAAKHIRDRGN